MILPNAWLSNILWRILIFKRCGGLRWLARVGQSIGCHIAVVWMPNEGKIDAFNSIIYISALMQAPSIAFGFFKFWYDSCETHVRYLAFVSFECHWIQKKANLESFGCIHASRVRKCHSCQSDVVRSRNWATVHRYWYSQADTVATCLRLNSCEKERAETRYGK